MSKLLLLQLNQEKDYLSANVHKLSEKDHRPMASSGSGGQLHA